MSLRQEVIDELFGGSKAAYWADVARGREASMRWQDVDASARCLPELERAGLDLIDDRLLYTPARHVTLPFEPLARALAQRKAHGKILQDAFLAEAETLACHVRNGDMRTGWDKDLEMGSEQLKNYAEFFPQYTHQARSRIKRFMGYRPAPLACYPAELLLRYMMARENYHVPEFITPLDFRVITIVKYREVLLEKGQVAADAMPLLDYGFVCNTGLKNYQK